MLKPHFNHFFYHIWLLDIPSTLAKCVRNVPLLDTSNAVVKALVDAAQVSGETTSGPPGAKTKGGNRGTVRTVRKASELEVNNWENHRDFPFLWL